MKSPGDGGLLTTLCHWITFLAQALPARSVPTFLELLIGSLLSPSGHVTDVWLSIQARGHWSTLYKWLEQGKWSWLRLTGYWVVLVHRVIKAMVVYWVLDDTLGYRLSHKAPGSQEVYNHSRKGNRPGLVRGQCWVSMAAAVQAPGRPVRALGLLHRLQRVDGQRSKLRSAQVLLRALRWTIEPGKTVRLLLDAWYMKQPVVSVAHALGVTVIGQIRRDSALYEPPPAREPGQRGRPRKYGGKYTPERVQQLAPQEVVLRIYGGKRRVCYRSAVVKARFLRGQEVRVVWTQFKNEDGSYTRTRLLLSTDVQLSAEQIIQDYARRWAIEPYFRESRYRWGWAQAWQQSRQVLMRWVHLLTISYGLAQLLSLAPTGYHDTWHNLFPWRENQPITTAHARVFLRRHFGQFRVNDWWDRTGRKFRPPRQADPPLPHEQAA
jgi:hypothetical protein